MIDHRDLTPIFTYYLMGDKPRQSELFGWWFNTRELHWLSWSDIKVIASWPSGMEWRKYQ